MERPQQNWTTTRNIASLIPPAVDERNCAALRELRAYSFLRAVAIVSNC